MADNQPTQEPRRKYAGKYDSPEALEEGYKNLFQEGQRLMTRTRTLEEHVRILQAVAEQRPEPQSDEEGGTQLRPEAIQQLVSNQVAETLRPLLTSAAKVGRLGSKWNDIGGFLEANPEIQATFQAIEDDKAAAEYAEAMFNMSQFAEGDKRVQASDAISAEARRAAMAIAEVPGSRAESRAPVDPEQEYSDELDTAWKRAEETGDATDYVRKRLFKGPNKIEIWAPGEPVPNSMLPKGK